MVQTIRSTTPAGSDDSSGEAGKLSAF